jgi:hypothetical protein
LRQEDSEAWTSADVRLATVREVEVYALSLCQFLRVREWRATPTTEPATHRQYENGDLIELSETPDYENQLGY